MTASELRQAIERALRDVRSHLDIELGQVLQMLQQLERLEREQKDGGP